jgi:hypothetical protein
VLLYYKENLYSYHENDKRVALAVSVIIGFNAAFGSETGEAVIFSWRPFGEGITAAFRRS